MLMEQYLNNVKLFDILEEYIRQCFHAKPELHTLALNSFLACSLIYMSLFGTLTSDVQCISKLLGLGMV